MPQRLYLRFLCVKRAVCSWVPEFAAYFRGRFQKCGVKPRSADQPRSYPSTTCGFVAKNRVMFGGFRFFPALPKNAAPHRELKRKSQHPRQHPVVAKTSKGRCRKTEQRPFFVIASRRVRDDCITEDIVSKRQTNQQSNKWQYGCSVPVSSKKLGDALRLEETHLQTEGLWQAFVFHLGHHTTVIRARSRYKRNSPPPRREGDVPMGDLSANSGTVATMDDQLQLLIRANASTTLESKRIVTRS